MSAASEDFVVPPQGMLSRYPSAWLIVTTLALLLGQAVAVGPTPPALSFLLLLLPFPLFLRRSGIAWTLLYLLAASALLLGYWRHAQILNPQFPSHHLRTVMQEGEQLYLEGELRAEPEKLPQRSRWIVRSLRIWQPTGAREIFGDLLLTVRSVSKEWRYGDRVRFWVKPQIPRDAGNPGGFDYAAYLARREIYATGFLVSDQAVELLGRARGGLWPSVEHLRREIRRYIETRMTGENGALTKALVVGDMAGISQEVRGAFTAAGVNHVLSISGLHVGMLGLVVFFLVRFLGSLSERLLLRCNLLKISTFCSFIAVLCYTALAGVAIPTLRSTIMIGVYELAVLLDREEEVFASLAFAALLIALAWPGVVMDISFQLSFLAVLFIVWGSRKMLEWWPPSRREELPQERSWLRPRLRRAAFYLAVPVLATIGTGPLIAHHFGHLSWAGFISNPLVVPFVGFIIVPLGLTIGGFALIAPSLAAPLVWLAEPLLSLVHKMVRVLSHLPMANVAVPIPNGLEIGLLYLAILAVLLFRRRMYLVVAVGAVSLLLVADIAYWWQERWNRKELRVTHLSVGHGDAAVVEFPGSKVLLIDAGGSASAEFDTGDFIVAPFLRSRKILKVDYLFVSHPRVDHYGGMKSIVEQFAPAEFWLGPSKGRTARYEGLEEAVDRAGVKKVYLGSRDPCRMIEQVKICVLYPAEDKTGDLSVVLRLSFGQVDLLFAGDMDAKGEAALLGGGADITSAVIKVPRHGSAAASTEEFVAAVKPKVAVFSVGQRNAFGLPRDEVLANYIAVGAEALRTDLDGAITIETDGQTIRYRTFRSGTTGTLPQSFIP
jgi:competence protein ComEC